MGEIKEKATEEMGVLEIKTSEILKSMQKEKWNDRVPDNYFIQVLHYLNVTGYSFADLFAELNYENNYQVTKTYEILREDVEKDIEYLQGKEIEFWNYVETKTRPPLTLPKV